MKADWFCVIRKTTYLNIDAQQSAVCACCYLLLWTDFILQHLEETKYHRQGGDFLRYDLWRDYKTPNIKWS